MSLIQWCLSSVAVSVAAVLAILLLLLAPPALAAGDTIQVLSDEAEVRFPGDVLFELELASEADVVEVRMYYRVAHSGVWSYSYLEVGPSRQVQTSFNLDLSGAGYLPPGTEMEYYYSILDSQGNTLKTVPETFVYLDDRFEWRTTEAGPLTIYWHDRSEERVREVARQVEDYLVDVSDLLNVELERQAKGIIYNSRSEAKAAVPQLSRTLTEGGVFQGFAFSEQGVFVGVGLQTRLLVHETAHLLLDEATNSPGARVPAWVNEGFASHVEPGSDEFTAGGGLPSWAASGKMPLRSMYSIPGRPRDIRDFYRKAESVVAYLLQTHGTEKFLSFVGELDSGRSDDAALRSTYDFGLEELDQRWRSALAGLRGPGDSDESSDGSGRSNGGGSFPVGALGSVVIAVLAVTAMAVMALRYIGAQWRRRSIGPEDWDGLTEEEWEDRP